MASKVLYPPIIDSYMSAFPASRGSCNIYFSLSKYNIGEDISSLHVSIVKQKNNANVVNTDKNNDGRYRATGIILNVDYTPDENQDNLYYFTINNNDLKSPFEPGEIYKIQIRFSSENYTGSSATKGQSDQLNLNASSFSEQSTICVIKAIGDMNIITPILNKQQPINTELQSSENITTLPYSTLDLSGSIEFVKNGKIVNDNEILYIYNISLMQLKNGKYEQKEESGNLYANEYNNINEFKYIFKTELEDQQQYKLIFDFTTNNYYKYHYEYLFTTELDIGEDNPIDIITIESDRDNILKDITSVIKEEEEGRIGLKLLGSNFTGNICIRRTDSKSNFSIQEDIKIVPIINESVSDLDIIYDYTIESGVYYKYGVQTINKNNERSILNTRNIPVMRDFEYSFLLGENNKQLKLKFNNVINNYKIQIMESKTEPLGGAFPVITRNAALKYKVFPITGTISFLMDENNLFCDRSILYENGGTDLQAESMMSTYGLIQDQYDYIYEREFRNKVLEFLYDGKPKLFKSPTEGNIIVRLTDISCTPNKSLDRIIYDFSSNANEIAEATYENYIKYNFLSIGEINTKLVDIDFKIGQVSGVFEVNKNILYNIYNKYDSKDTNSAGKDIQVLKVYNIRITIEDKPLRYENGQKNEKEMNYLLGNKVHIGTEDIMILAPQRIYELDSRISFSREECQYTEGRGIYFLPDSETANKIANMSEEEKRKFSYPTISAKIDFLYELQTEDYETKKIIFKQNHNKIGQISGHYKSGTSIVGEISKRYYFEDIDKYRQLKSISSIEIEGRPGLIFSIKDKEDNDFEFHEINDTGILRLYEIEKIQEIIFYGERNRDTGDKDNQNISADISVTYQCKVQNGIYEIKS